MRDQVFISYAREDREWLDRFLTHLGAAEKRGLLKIWCDDAIQPGRVWLEEIRSALDHSRVGLLLVSGNFLNSTFIRDDELRAILSAREAGELLLYWVPISASLFQITDLKALQCATDPDRPLATLSSADQDREIVKICKKILNEMGSLPSLTSADRDDLQRRVKDRLGATYDLLEEISIGSTSIVYKAAARQPDFTRTVAVKTLVASEVQRTAEKDFRDRLRVASGLTSPAYIKIYSAFLDSPPYCVITEYVDGCPLDRYIETNALCPRRIRDILLDLSTALAEAHQHGCVHQGLVPSNVFIDRLHRARLSAFRFLSLGPDANTWGTFLINHETLSYISPEQFEGRPRTALSDQYALGLLGYELIARDRIEAITCPADFLRRPTLFEKLSSAEAWAERAPGIGGIVSRMLRVDPGERWASMHEVVRMLEALPVVDSADDELRGRVLASYAVLQQSPQRSRRLFDGFYRELFELIPEVKPFFPTADQSMMRQYDAINRALKLLIDYDPESPQSKQAIADIARNHARFQLGERHVQAFETAFGRALQKQGTDAEIVDAWHAVLHRGLSYFAQMLTPPSQAAKAAAQAPVSGQTSASAV